MGAMGVGQKIRQGGGAGDMGGGGGGSQLGRRDRHSGTLGIVQPLRMYLSAHTSIVVHFDVIFVTLRQVLVFWQRKIFH
jgi:hypothetical protein